MAGRVAAESMAGQPVDRAAAAKPAAGRAAVALAADTAVGRIDLEAG